MPITITSDDHIITFDAVSDPERLLITCSCGEDLSRDSDKSPGEADVAARVIGEHLAEAAS